VPKFVPGTPAMPRQVPILLFEPIQPPDAAPLPKEESPGEIPSPRFPDVTPGELPSPRFPDEAPAELPPPRFADERREEEFPKAPANAKPQAAQAPAFSITASFALPRGVHQEESRATFGSVIGLGDIVLPGPTHR
jgi:hypothetical protein